MKNEMFVENNPYGYRVNINHPEIRKYYERYKAWKKIPIWCPMSDAERREFEAYIIPKISNPPA